MPNISLKQLAVLIFVSIFIFTDFHRVHAFIIKCVNIVYDYIKEKIEEMKKK